MFLKQLQREFPFDFTHEPRLGIPMARNRALEWAVQNRYALLAFIDDDCLPEEGWLNYLATEFLTQDLDVVMGGATIVPLGSKSRWLPKRVFGLQKFSANGVTYDSGELVPSAWTRSVLFDISEESIIQRHQMKFDENLYESGGSDMEFFFRISGFGGKILYTETSQVIEYYGGERLTLWWHFLRKFRYGQNKAERKDVNVKGVARRFVSVSMSGLAHKSIFELCGMVLLKLAPILGLVLFPVYKHKEYRIRN